MKSDFLTLENIADLKPIECPTRGNINFPCVICKGCDIGIAEIELGDGFLIDKTVNSILIHLLLGLTEDPLEKLALTFLKNDLSKIVPLIQKSDWEEGDLTILITDDMKDDVQKIQNISNFLEDFPNNWRLLVIEAKRSLKKWSDQNSKQLAHKYFKELRDN